MSVTQIEHTETEKLVLGWRRSELRRAGYNRKQASTVAARLDVDLHLAVELLERGCDPAIALKILL